jgi:Family of unknown function (DUF5682)
MTIMEFSSAILNLDAPAVFFPVRHHSPACAQLVRELAHRIKPAAILIEGPSDFNPQIAELNLPHELPIAIYSFANLGEGTRRGAFYPYCIYSPEWQALQVAQELGIPAQFIDLPWADIAAAAVSSHRYADTELRQSRYVSQLCETLGIEGLDNLWDQLFEIDPHLSLETYLERCHQFCFHCRVLDGCGSDSDRQREAFMAEQIQQAMSRHAGPILVVTGGFHSYPLFAKVLSYPFEESLPAPENVQQLLQQAGIQIPAPELPSLVNAERGGIALTPFTYDRLDRLTGYDAGMPSPGFYHQVWCDRTKVPESFPPQPNYPIYRRLLAQVAVDLRQRKQQISSADLIAVETTAQGLATLRGHREVWRQDIVDGIIAALIKDELTPHTSHPFLAAVYEGFRGNARGRLAAGTSVPPLVADIKQQLQTHDLLPQNYAQAIKINFHDVNALRRSQVLHQLRVLDIAGYDRINGTDFATRLDLAYLWEEWAICWSPAYEGSCIEAAIYGSTLAEAAENRVLALAAKVERQAETAALLLLDTALMGLRHLTQPLTQRLLSLIRSDSDFFTVTSALGHLLYLYRYDEVLGTSGSEEVGHLLQEVFNRGLWLLESLGQVQGNDQALLQGVKILLETFERSGKSLNLNQTALVDVLGRVSTDSLQNPLLRGAVMGALWGLGETPTAQVLTNLPLMGNPDRLGDFLTGLFCLAREVVQREPDLLQQLDQLLSGFDEDMFLVALPALRLAFTYFTPREKHAIARTLVQTWDTPESSSPLPQQLDVAPEEVARAKALEASLLEALTRYGLRGGSRGSTQ